MITINKQSIKAPSLVLSNGADNINLASIADGGHVNMSVGSHIQVLGTNAETNFTGTVSASYDTLNITAQNLTARNDKGTLYSATELSNTLYVPHLDSDKANIQQLNVAGTLAVTGDITLSVSNTSLNEELNRLETSITAVNDKQDWTVSTINATSGRIGPVDIKATAVQSYASITAPGVQADTGVFGTVETDSLVVDYLDTATVNTQELTAATGDINAFQAGDVNTSTLTAIEATINAIHTKTIKADVSGLTLYGLNSQYDYLTFKDTRTALTSKRDVTIKHTGELDSYISLSDAKGISLTTGETTIHNVVQQIGNIQSSIIELTGIDTSVVTSLGQQILNNTSDIVELTTEMSARTLYVDTELEAINTSLSKNTSDIFSLTSLPENITIGEVNPTNPNPGNNEINAIGFGKNTLPADGVNKPVIAIEMTLKNSSDIPTYLAIYNYDRAWSGTGGGFRLLAVSKPVTWNVGDVVRWEFETPVVIPTQNFIQMYFLRTPTPPVDGAEAHNLEFVYIKVDTFAGNNNDWGHRYARTWYFGREWDITFIFTEAGRVYALEEQVEANTSAINWLSEADTVSGDRIVDGTATLKITENDALHLSGVPAVVLSNSVNTLQLYNNLTVAYNSTDKMLLAADRISINNQNDKIEMKNGEVLVRTNRMLIDYDGVGPYDIELDTTNSTMLARYGRFSYTNHIGYDEGWWRKAVSYDSDLALTLGAWISGMTQLETRHFDTIPVLDMNPSTIEFSLLAYNNCITDLGVLPNVGSPIKILNVELYGSINTTNQLYTTSAIEAEVWYATNSSSYTDFVWPNTVKFISAVPDLSQPNTRTRLKLRREPDGTILCWHLYSYEVD